MTYQVSKNRNWLIWCMLDKLFYSSVCLVIFLQSVYTAGQRLDTQMFILYTLYHKFDHILPLNTFVWTCNHINSRPLTNQSSQSSLSLNLKTLISNNLSFFFFFAKLMARYTVQRSAKWKGFLLLLYFSINSNGSCDVVKIHFYLLATWYIQLAKQGIFL